MESSTIFPVLTLVGGWFLNETSRLLNTRHEKKNAIGLAIADLLEIRHEFRTIQLVMSEMTARFKLPAEHHPAFKKFIKSFLPQQENLSQRYNDAVSLIASADPILGFSLRSKDKVSSYLQKISNIAPYNDEAAAYFYQIESKLEKIMIPNIEDTVKDLAKFHGPITFIKIWKFLRQPLSVPNEIEEYLLEIETQNQS